jgi:hypothetical protein
MYKDTPRPALVTHACNPSHSRGRELEDRGSKPSQCWAKSSRDPISKNPSQKRAGRVAQGVGPEFKPQHLKKKDTHPGT